MIQSITNFYNELRKDRKNREIINRNKKNDKRGEEFLNILLSSYGEYFERVDCFGNIILKPFYELICKKGQTSSLIYYDYNIKKPYLSLELKYKEKTICFHQEIPKNKNLWIKIIDKIKDIYKMKIFIDLEKISDKQFLELLRKFYKIKSDRFHSNKDYGKNLGLADAIILEEKGVPRCRIPYFIEREIKEMIEEKETRNELFKYILEEPLNRMVDCFNIFYKHLTIGEIIKLIDNGIE